MPFSNVPVKNPGRYFEQFVKVVQPKANAGGSNVQNMQMQMSSSGGSSSGGIKSPWNNPSSGKESQNLANKPWMQ